MNALIIGAGAVGQVFAQHLSLGGTNATFLTKNNAFPQELILYPHNGRSRPIVFRSFNIMTEFAQAAEESWDQVYLCIPSDALRNSLFTQIAKFRRSPTIIKIQPGLNDHGRYAKHFEKSRIVSGMVGFVSYAAPLAGEKIRQSATAYWFPPMLPSRFSGSEERVNEVIRSLKSGGFPARTHPDVEQLLGFVLATQSPLTAGFECSGWSLQAFRKQDWLKVACKAIRQANAVAANHIGYPMPGILKLMHCSVIRLVIGLLPLLYPFDLEAYLKVHYRKLSLQSRQHLDDYLEHGRQVGIGVDALLHLRQGLDHN